MGRANMRPSSMGAWGLLVAFFTLALGIESRSGSAIAADIKEMINRKRDGVVYIEATAEDNKGERRTTKSTGFYIDREGNILTAFHALSELGDYRPDTLSVTVHRGRKDNQAYSAAPVDSNASRDLLLLRADNLAESKPICTSVDRAPSSIVGEEVYTVGFPNDLPFVSASGRVTSTDGPGGTLITDMVINPGQSGSPVFLKDGTVVGIAKGQMEVKGKGVAGQYVIIPLTYAQPILPSLVGNPGCANEQVSEINPNSLSVGTENSVDIIAIVDDSASMYDDQKKFFEAFTLFMKDLDADEDVRVCLLTTDAGFYKGNVLPWVTRAGSVKTLVTNVLDKNTPDFDRVVKDTLASIGSEWSSDEQGIKSLNLHVRYRADKGCLRQKGVLIAIVLSDENERSIGGNLGWSTEQYKPLDKENYPDDLLSTISRILPSKVFVWNSIIVVPGDEKCEKIQDAQESPSFFGTLYKELSEKTGGYVGSICKPDFKVHFEGIGQAVQDKINSAAPH
ncbi:serine protease [Rhizobium sp. RMa-01]|uniref:S1 family peptidase n=1 Tax=unclassified Rhizobium TaxID=2613769 RepID=UPI0008D91550|nr:MULTISPECIES: serine protease [unclassified Rhizobium]OHV26730.1 hypothetical protein BBJ66_01615 [Rhizobium sp. RSm-3]RVU10032.1 serine protease [Rhizobium sp. RMa-01]